MAWIYLAALEDSHLDYPTTLGLSHTASKTAIARRCSCLGCVQAISELRQSGMTCVRCEEANWKVSTSSTADSPARTLAVQEMESAWEASAADFSSTSQGLSKKQTRDLYFSKTSQQLELVASTVSRKHLPNSGMIVGGRLYQPAKLAPVTLEKDGSCLPTPRAQSSTGSGPSRVGHRKDLQTVVKEMVERRVVPTPRAIDWKGAGGKNRQSPDLPLSMGGNLNPQFVEEIMGYRTGWTELSASVTQWFRSKRKRRSKDCVV